MITAPIIEFVLYDSWKVCGCGHRWVGKTFKKPATPDELVEAMCDRCVRRNEQLLQQIVDRPRVRLVGEPTADQDQPYQSRRLA